MTAFHTQILSDVQTEIQGLDLSGIEDSSVIIQSVPDDHSAEWPRVTGTQNPKYPGISITPIGTEILGPGTNSGDDIGYPVSVFFVDSSDGFDRDRWLTWRQSVFDHFVEARLAISGLEGQELITKCRFGPTLDPAAWQSRHVAVGRLNIEAHFRKQRRA